MNQDIYALTKVNIQSTAFFLSFISSGSPELRDMDMDGFASSKFCNFRKFRVDYLN